MPRNDVFQPTKMEDVTWLSAEIKVLAPVGGFRSLLEQQKHL
jgi:hypothetical protein